MTDKKPRDGSSRKKLQTNLTSILTARSNVTFFLYPFVDNSFSVKFGIQPTKCRLFLVTTLHMHFVGGNFSWSVSVLCLSPLNMLRYSHYTFLHIYVCVLLYYILKVNKFYQIIAFAYYPALVSVLVFGYRKNLAGQS